MLLETRNTAVEGVAAWALVLVGACRTHGAQRFRRCPDIGHYWHAVLGSEPFRTRDDLALFSSSDRAGYLLLLALGFDLAQKLQQHI